MFDDYSNRSRQIIFGTRVKAGRRGAEALDIGDLIVAFVLEDQNMTARLMGHEAEVGQVFGLEPHSSFLSTQTAVDLLDRLGTLLPQSTPIADATDMSITKDLQTVLASAAEVKERFKHKQIEPLHLLAAVLATTGRPEVEELKSHGITEAVVHARLTDLM